MMILSLIGMVVGFSLITVGFSKAKAVAIDHR